jgi:hypothetical protein
MWLQKKIGSCARHGKALRNLAEDGPDRASAEELMAQAAPSLREHLASCKDCRKLLQDTLAGATLLHAAYQRTVDPGETFSGKVIAAIRALEAERSTAMNLWAAMQALATRVAWVSALALLVACAWLYEYRGTQPPATAREYTAERFMEPAPQPATADDVLASLAETNP